MTTVMKDMDGLTGALVAEFDETTHAPAVVVVDADGKLVPPGSNITTKFREAFETLSADRWNIVTDPLDVVMVDGNAGGASYLTISKSPFTRDTQTIVESVATFGMPVEAAFGAHMSQRTLGQQFALEVVSTETPDALPADVAIATIQQVTTTLTVTTATPHNLKPGARISIHGVADSRMNYPALVVASTANATTFTATAGPGGTIPSVTAGPFASGFVAARTAMAGAPNGTSMLFENASSTNASFYVKSENCEPCPIGGTILGSHSATIGTTTSVQAINAALAYAFRPTNEYRLALMADRIQWQDAPVDTTAQAIARATFSQIAPSPDVSYKIRIRGENLKSLTVPLGAIISATKTGTATATVVTDGDHGLTTGDVINIFGARDTVNFPNLTAATAVASVVNSTTFTVVWGGAVTATSYGGYVSRVNGGQTQQGAITQVVQSASITNSILTLVGSAAWTGVQIGDYVNVLGARGATAGAPVGIDNVTGAYRVSDIATTNLVLEPIGATTIPATLASVNCGGGVLKRTDLRVSFLRVFDYERLRVEALSRPTGDIAGAMPVAVQNTALTVVIANGQGAEDAAVAGNAVRTGGRVRTSAPTTFVANDAADVTITTGGAQVMRPYAVPEADWSASLALTTTTAAALQAAGGAGLKRHITALQAINTGAAAVDLILLDGATERWRLPLPINVPVSIQFPTGLILTANTALNANLSAVGTVRINAQGYTAP